MGFTIFESSGTFKPSDYGLSPGDVIHVTAVGGGGGGSYANWAGGAGGASSFGSILTAAGGAPGSVEQYPSIVTVTGRNNPIRGYQYYANYYVVSSSNSALTNQVQIWVGSQGADGWLPGRPFKTTPSYPHRFFLNDLPATAYLSTFNSSIQGATSLIDEHIWNVGGYMPKSGQLAPLAAAQNVPMAGYGNSTTHDTNTAGVMKVFLGGAGGIGYGAGGGGSYQYYQEYALSGGYSGVKADIDYVLQSMDAVTVTVGNGGNGASSSYGAPYGGGGACGCVAFWW